MYKMGGYQFFGRALEAHDAALDPILEAVALKYVSVSGGNNFVGIDGLGEGHVGRAVAYDDRAGPVEDKGGGRALVDITVRLGPVVPAIVAGCPVPMGKTAVGIEAAAAAAGQDGGLHGMV